MSVGTIDDIFIHGKERDFTEDEYFALSDEMWAADERGDIETYNRIDSILPANPAVAKIFKDVYGKEYLVSLGLDLTEANMCYGEGWLEADER